MVFGTPKHPHRQAGSAAVGVLKICNTRPAECLLIVSQSSLLRSGSEKRLDWYIVTSRWTR